MKRIIGYMIFQPITEQEEEQEKEESRNCMLRGMKQVKENHNENEANQNATARGEPRKTIDAMRKMRISKESIPLSEFALKRNNRYKRKGK